MGFVKWFKASLEDEKGVASFRRIYNYILIALVCFVVIWHTVKDNWSGLIIDVLIILLLAGFLNIGTITADNILRFFNRDRDQPQQQPEQPKQADISGTVTLTEPSQQKS